MVKAYERKTPSLPDRIYLIDPDGHYYSIYQGNPRWDHVVPDYTCEVLVEYLTSNPEEFYLRSWEGTYFQYYDDDHITPCVSKDVRDTTIAFTALDLEAKDTFAFRASNGKFLVPKVVDVGYSKGLPLADFAKVTVLEPAIKKAITNIVYDVKVSTITDLTPEIALKTTIRNDSDSNNFTQSLMYSYLVSDIGTWSNTFGGSIAFKASIKCGIPFLADGKVETTITGNYSHMELGSQIHTKTVTSTSTVAIPPKKKGVATVLVNKAVIDVPFTYIETIWYRSGRFEEVTKKGVYNNVESYRVDVQITDLVGL